MTKAAKKKVKPKEYLKRRYGVMLTTGQMASLVNVTRKTVVKWIDNGLVKSVNLPGSGERRVHRDVFRKFLVASDYTWAAEDLDARIAEQDE